MKATRILDRPARTEPVSVQRIKPERRFGVSWFGEIDLVCRDREGYVFVEVKTRRAGSFVAAAEAVDRRKLGRLARLGAGWLALRGERGARWRILVAALTVGPRGARVELLEAGP